MPTPDASPDPSPDPGQGPTPYERWPSASVVVINLDGRDRLEACLDSVLAQEYPEAQLEVIVVDNASTDGSVEFLRQRYPDIQIIVNDRNVGFAPAVNQGAEAAHGEYLALINNDAVADPKWLRELIRPMTLNRRIGCTGGLVLEANGEVVEFAGGGAAFHGHGFGFHQGEAVPSDLRQQPVLFATGSSLATRRKVFLKSGGFDADYFAYFEDVDYGWRLWALGHDVLFVPSARTLHEGGATTKRFGEARWQYLIERNALFTIFKNYEDERLSHTLPAATVLAVLRGLEDDGTDLGDYAIRPDTAGRDIAPTLSETSGASLAALRDFGRALPRLREKRDEIQSRRRRSDRELVRLFRHPFLGSIVPSDAYRAALDQLVETFDLLSASTAQAQVLVVCADKLGKKMAGPAIRSWEMAKLLAREHQVVLGSTSEPELSSDAFAVEHLTPDKMRDRIHWADVIVIQGITMWWYPEMLKSRAAIVVDIYDPFHIEGMTMRRNAPPEERWFTARTDVQIVNQQLERGDLFLCASPKQRDFWLGQLAALGRINPATYDQDPDLRSLLEIAPFGLPPEPPVQQRHAIKGTVEGIGADDLVLIWGGGIYNWFDPLTLIRAVGQAATDDPRVRLFFLGTAHPNPDSPKMAMAAQAYRLAESLGLLGKHVFFNDGWAPYDERADWLLDSDIGVSTHFLHIETELSYRTRFLDYIWAGLPILGTEGDSLSNMVREHDLGEVVRAEDVDDVTAGILRLTDADRRDVARANISALASGMTWERSLEPLLSFARVPRRAPDLDPDAKRRYVDKSTKLLQRDPRRLAERFFEVARDRGMGTAVQMARETLKRQLGR